MKRKRIVFASVLKPVDDPRTYLKLAKSLVPSDKYDVNIIGFPGKAPITDPQINFFPLKSFTRKSIQRLLAPAAIEKLIKRLEPDLLIINTHELLGVAKRLKTKDLIIIYDVRENYELNMIKRKHWRSRLAARLTRRKERRSAAYIDHYILAEQCYVEQLDFTRNAATVLENKALSPELTPVPNSNKDKYTFVFTGTLARHTGILQSIQMVEDVWKYDSSVQLLICGNSFDTRFLSELMDRIDPLPWVKANISETPLPYEQILQTLSKADAAIISYATWVHDKMPTKLFEYLALEIPIVFIEHSLNWKEICNEYSAAIVYESNPEQLMTILTNSQFYINKPGPEVRWESEGITFNSVVEKFLRF